MQPRIAGTRPKVPVPIIDWSNRFTVPYRSPRPAIAVQRIELLAQDASKDKVLPPTLPNAGTRAQYKKRMLCLVDAMHRSVQRWVMAAYRKNEPHASDADPADEMQKVMRELRKHWDKQFDEGAEKLAKHFAKSVSRRTDTQLKEILRKAGISVPFAMTKAQRDISKAVVHENVSLIKSIPQQYLKNVEGMVMRSVQTGRDAGELADQLQDQFGVSTRRASLIARDQNNKATAAFNRSRQMEVGIEEAIWQHSSAGKDPRPSHVKAGRDKTRYNIAEGWYDPDAGENIWPGTLINCRCTSRSVIPGFV